MKTICLLALLANLAGSATGQNSTDSAQQKQVSASADDPSQFFTRIEGSEIDPVYTKQLEVKLRPDQSVKAIEVNEWEK